MIFNLSYFNTIKKTKKIYAQMITDDQNVEVENQVENTENPVENVVPEKDIDYLLEEYDQLVQSLIINEFNPELIDLKVKPLDPQSASRLIMKKMLNGFHKSKQDTGLKNFISMLEAWPSDTVAQHARERIWAFVKAYKHQAMIGRGVNQVRDKTVEKDIMRRNKYLYNTDLMERFKDVIRETLAGKIDMNYIDDFINSIIKFESFNNSAILDPEEKLLSAKARVIERVAKYDRDRLEKYIWQYFKKVGRFAHKDQNKWRTPPAYYLTNGYKENGLEVPERFERNFLRKRDRLASVFNLRFYRHSQVNHVSF